MGDVYNVDLSWGWLPAKAKAIGSGLGSERLLAESPLFGNSDISVGRERRCTCGRAHGNNGSDGGSEVGGVSGGVGSRYLSASMGELGMRENDSSSDLRKTYSEGERLTASSDEARQINLHEVCTRSIGRTNKKEIRDPEQASLSFRARLGDGVNGAANPIRKGRGSSSAANLIRKGAKYDVNENEWGACVKVDSSLHQSSVERGEKRKKEEWKGESDRDEIERDSQESDDCNDGYVNEGYGEGESDESDVSEQDINKMESMHSGDLAALQHCPICFESYPRYQMRSFTTCAQNHTYCTECLTAHLNSLINDIQTVTHLHCPSPDCPAVPSEEDVRALVSKSQYDKYLDFAARGILMKENLRWCPFPGCEEAVLVENTEEKKIVCPSCKRPFCCDCNLVWHEGKSCSANLLTSSDGSSSLSLAKADVKKISNLA